MGIIRTINIFSMEYFNTNYKLSSLKRIIFNIFTETLYIYIYIYISPFVIVNVINDFHFHFKIRWLMMKILPRDLAKEKLN